jgi:ATP-binding protein involved in chromosome partitioning
MMSIGLMLERGQGRGLARADADGRAAADAGAGGLGRLDVLIVDLPPGTGDVQLTLCQRTQVTGAIVVSTPQDVALLDARKAMSMFHTLKTPILGLIENMSTYVCPNCGHEAHIFGHGGVAAEAEKLGVPFLGEIPLSLEVRVAGDSGHADRGGRGAGGTGLCPLAERLIARRDGLRRQDLQSSRCAI